MKPMIINQQVRVFPELLTRSSYDDLAWQPFRQGVEIGSVREVRMSCNGEQRRK